MAVLLLHMGALALWPQTPSVQPLHQRPDLTVRFFAPQPVPPATPAPPASAQPSRALAAAQPSKPVATEPAQPRTETIAEPSPTASEQAPGAPVGLPTAASPSLAVSNTEADFKATHLNNPSPPYPFAAVRQGAEGRVLLMAEVLPDGRAASVRLEKSSGHAVLDAAAMNTVRTWRFTPARKDGVPITQTVSIPIDFTLKNRR